MSENSRNEKKRSGSPPPLPLATIRATGLTAADTIAVVGTKRRILLTGGRPTTQTWEIITPLPILILVFQYLDQDGLMTASTVSKQWHQIIDSNPGMAQHRIIPVLKISASKNKSDRGRMERLMAWLGANRNKLQRYRVLQLLDVNKFDRSLFNRSLQWFYRRNLRFQLNGIVSFDLSSPSKLSRVNCDVLELLSYMLPNLRAINLSNIGGVGFHSVLDLFIASAPQLERITWNNIDTDCNIDINGCDMIKATNLREIMMDGSVFSCYDDDMDGNDIVKLSDLENHPSIYLFCRWTSQVVERISIRRAKLHNYDQQICKTVPQNALIKYIRNAPPSLRWFRSDLSQNNIDMLRLERPGIEFLN